MANISIEVRPGGRERRVRVVRVSGEVDAHTFSDLQDTLERLTQAGHTDLVLDCSELRYISSAGLGVLKQTAFALRRRGGDIRLAALPDKVETVMQLLGFTRLIQTFPNAARAVRSFTLARRRRRGDEERRP